MSETPSDPWSRVDYRRMILWEKRIRREAPMLRRLLEKAPERSVVDLGAGTGEHVAFFAGEGARAVGLDRSAEMVAKARDHEAAGHGRFLEGDLLEADRVLAGDAPFGLAICLGNVLPHLGDDDAIDRLAAVLRAILLPGGIAWIQILSYAKLRAEDTRALPVNVREEEDGTRTVFLRLIEPDGDRWMRFYPTALTLTPGAEEPVRVVRSREVRLRTWTREDLVRPLESHGFEVVSFGDVEGGPYDPRTSSDLVLEARRTT